MSSGGTKYVTLPAGHDATPVGRVAPAEAGDSAPVADPSAAPPAEAPAAPPAEAPAAEWVWNWKSIHDLFKRKFLQWGLY